MKIKNNLPILVSLLLTGCLSTPNEARNSEALLTGSSSKSSEVLTSCIYEGWTNKRVMFERDNTTHVERNGNKITIFSWKDTMFADVYPKGDGAEVKFYKTFSMGYTIADNRKEVVEGCL
ncbi:hypothetical protein [Pragia fontium]|uniref:hypothetical protein n=1 Tax=Pragia fontium TaxID=82985 RepID=UPI00064AC980|nr:hypothetical protein [Pragia fontium]AKJ43691.1 hypothetical protein QQ39_00080 [Pragia fontium]